MGTSEPWLRRVGDYLGSNRNIVGSVAGLAALGATLPTHVAGPLWPVVVGGVYGIAALLTPADKVRFVDPGYQAAVARAESLRADLARLGARVATYERRLPEDVVAAYRRIEAHLAEVLGRAGDLATSPDHLFVVGRTINEYLPTSLETYANLPRSFAMSRRGASRSAHEELLAQLALLDRELGDIAAAVYAGDVATLTAQGRFLEDKFAESSFDLSSVPTAGDTSTFTIPPISDTPAAHPGPSPQDAPRARDTGFGPLTPPSA